MSTPKHYDSCKVATPEPLAKAMVSALGDKPGHLWLEPAVGDGVFIRILADGGVPSKRIVALDLERSSCPNDRLARTMRGVDFIGWSLSTSQRFDKVVGNPPYLPLEKLSSALQQAALRVKTLDGHSVSLNANSWYAFLCASMSLLKESGSLCFVLPASWDYANYAATLRSAIAHFFRRFEVHRSRRPLFDGVQEGCIVILGIGYGGNNGAPRVLRFDYDSLEELAAGLKGSRNRRSKRNGRSINVIDLPHLEKCQLGEVIEIRLGAVTGDSSFFLMNEARRRQLGLPRESVCPALSRARHLVGAGMTKTVWHSLRTRGERVWLFAPPRQALRHKRVGTYLRLPVRLGGCHRGGYKIRNRKEWYRAAIPMRVHGFISGMCALGPWICLNQMRGLIATNTLYVVRFRKACRMNEKAAWALSLLTTPARKALESVGRLYADQLVKYEPLDLAGIYVPVPRRSRGAMNFYKRVIERLLAGDVYRAKKMADAWFGLSNRSVISRRVR